MNPTQTTWKTAWVRCGWLAGLTAGLWLLLAGPAWALGGAAGLEGLTWAAGLCLVPGLAVIWLASVIPAGKDAAVVTLAGTGLRLLFVLGGLFVVREVRGHLGFREFIVWLLVFFLAMLAAETLLVVRGQSEQENKTAGQGESDNDQATR